MYAIDLKENKLQGFVNITGKRVQSEDLGNNDQAKDTGLPTWAKILISVVSIVVVAIILVVFWFCLRYKKKAREGDNNSKKMQDIWATSEVEASGNKQAVVALNLKNAADRPEQTETTLNEDSIMNYDCFKHEVDLQDMEDSKTFKIV
jgi:FtsZ-interacting cell division protein ZipA